MPEVRPTLSKETRHLVHQSWVYLRSSMFKVGIILFTAVFEAVPSLERLFLDPERSPEQAWGPAAQHSQLLMLAVDKVNQNTQQF